MGEWLQAAGERGLCEQKCERAQSWWLAAVERWDAPSPQTQAGWWVPTWGWVAADKVPVTGGSRWLRSLGLHSWGLWVLILRRRAWSFGRGQSIGFESFCLKVKWIMKTDRLFENIDRYEQNIKLEEKAKAQSAPWQKSVPWLKTMPLASWGTSEELC